MSDVIPWFRSSTNSEAQSDGGNYWVSFYITYMTNEEIEILKYYELVLDTKAKVNSTLRAIITLASETGNLELAAMIDAQLNEHIAAYQEFKNEYVGLKQNFLLRHL